MLAGCAAPKADVVEEPKAKSERKPATEEVSETKLPDHGLRVGNMLELPKDGEFRATNPNAARSGTGGGAVIVSPTTKPSDSAKPDPSAEKDAPKPTGSESKQ